ncbi:MAG TPA: 2-phospho-L-lactate transferase [SAR324 cluster bacterium]|jgi:LPPG:FO 2-phospho-L-lactate transferase|nr:2-phospho-L-lactate transferase [SAR324 cluster bacterium]|tara:strand:- start:1945 stop:2901 length:957 start_codon:yes stop_codon:yes gene_type:complete
MVVNNLVTHLALSGGIGGAKLALGLEHVFNSSNLMIAGNTGDDFKHFGLHISPDLDTLLYTLSGKSDTERGWGLSNETWSFMEAMGEMGGETWFQLGDRDLATHVERTRRLNEGENLSSITSSFCKIFGVKAQIVPATDDPLKTLVQTPEGILTFQNYFVRDQCRSKILSLKYEGSENAQPCSALEEALESSFLEAVFVCPSNPFLSIDPILSVGRIKEKLKKSTAKVIAISPIVGGDAVKGPTAKNLRDLGYEVSAFTVAEYYSDFIDGFILDKRDEKEIFQIESLGIRVGLADTVMIDLQSKIKLAESVMLFLKKF